MTAAWQSAVAALGGVVGLLLFLSPMRAVLRARSERVLGDLNPLPFPTVIANCCGWVAYGYVTDDVLVLWPNMCGVLLGLFYTLSAYGLADTKTRDRQIAILLVFATVIMVVGAVGTLGDLDYDQLKRLWGFTSNAILLIFYASPLSTIFEVVRSRSSASLQLPLSIMNAVNGGLWLVYGLAITDLFIAVPNGVGCVLGIVYCTLIFVFPAPKVAKQSPSSSDNGTSTSQRELISSAADSELMPPGKLAAADVPAGEGSRTPGTATPRAGSSVAIPRVTTGGGSGGNLPV